MCLRPSPRLLGRSPMGLNTFVAMTISSSFAYSRSALPVISSLRPSEYMSAVSKKVMPASTARLKKGSDAFASSTQLRQLGSP